MPSSTNAPLTKRQAGTIAGFLHKHAGGCKKPLDDCKACQAAIKWFKELPLPMLSIVLADYPKAKA